MENKVRLGITEWSLPVDGPYGCNIAADVGFEGVQLDIGSYIRNFPKTKRCVQDAYLEAAEKFGIHDIIDPRETRPRLISVLRSLMTKRDSNPPKKHGNIPL